MKAYVVDIPMGRSARLISSYRSRRAIRQSAALPLATVTSWDGLVDHAGVHPGQTLLIHAGAGGVGDAAVQTALERGGKVFTTVSADKRALVETIDAVAIDRHVPPGDYIAEHTGGEDFDIVYDTLGGERC